MTNIVALRRPQIGLTAAVPAIPALAEMFMRGRRDRHDAYWLKENAEFLQILAATGARTDFSDYGADYGAVVLTLLGELHFFPQYYRMYLSIGLDLQLLGLPDVPVDAMAAYIVAEGLAEAEVSDMHRAEAQLLLARAGRGAKDAGVQTRLAHFTAQSPLFAVPNRRAAYDLTHVVFHSADYGRRQIPPDPSRSRSLMNAGIVAWLDDNLDLLAEVTVALRLGADPVPLCWDKAVAQNLARFTFETGPEDAARDDDYHAFLVQSWAVSVAGEQAFAGHIAQGTSVIRSQGTNFGTLRAMTLALMDMGAARRTDWAQMRWRMAPHLSAPQRAHLAEVETLPEFADFFAGFARCGRGSV